VSLVGEVGAEDDAPSVHARFSPFDWSEPVRLRLRLVPLLDDDDDDDEDDAGAETAVGDATCIVSVVAEEVESVEAAMVLVFDGATDCCGVVVVGAGEASDSVDGDATAMASELARSIVLVVAAVVGHLMRQERWTGWASERGSRLNARSLSLYCCCCCFGGGEGAAASEKRGGSERAESSERRERRGERC